MAENTQRTTKPLKAAQPGDPGYGLGIAGFVVSFFVSIAGLVMSAIALKQSKDAGLRNGFALWGLIIGIVKTALEVLAVLGLILIGVFALQYCNSHPSECRDNNYRYESSDHYYRNDSSDPTPTY